ncbi:MAG: hypothetical protein WCL50_19130, partial [Spirochaetota bacterium]
TDANLAGYYQYRVASFNRALDAYLGKRIKPPALAPWLIGGGIAVAGGAVAIFATGYDATLAQNVKGELLSSYLAETNPANVGKLHDQIQNGITLANTLGYGKWIGSVAGPLISYLGIRMAIEGDPKNTFLRYMDGFFKASIDSRRRFEKRLAKRPGDAILLAPSMDAVIEVNQAKDAIPVFIDLRRQSDLVIASGGVWASSLIEMPLPRPRLLVFLNPWEIPGLALPSFGSGVIPAWTQGSGR